MAKSGDGESHVPFQQFDRWATFFLSNLAWVVFAVPIVTLPLGMVGLFQIMSLWTRGKQPEFFKDFFGAIRNYWWKALIIGLIDVVVGGLILGNLMILNIMGFSNLFVLFLASLTVFVALVLLMTNLYIWSLLVVAEFGLRRVLMLSLKLVLAHPFRTFGILVVGLLPLMLALLLKLPTLLWLLGLISFSILIINKGTWSVIRLYTPEAELLKYETIADKGIGKIPGSG